MNWRAKCAWLLAPWRGPDPLSRNRDNCFLLGDTEHGCEHDRKACRVRLAPGASVLAHRQAGMVRPRGGRRLGRSRCAARFPALSAIRVDQEQATSTFVERSVTRHPKELKMRTVPRRVACLALLPARRNGVRRPGPQQRRPTLPEGFSAVIVQEGQGTGRHLTARPTATCTRWEQCAARYQWRRQADVVTPSGHQRHRGAHLQELAVRPTTSACIAIHSRGAARARDRVGISQGTPACGQDLCA